MDRTAAAALLQVAEDAPPEEVRRAFRLLLHRLHPDHAAGGDPAATRDLIEAYRTLTDGFGGGPPTAEVSGPAPNDTVTFALPPDETFLALLDAADRIGDVTYVDDDAGLLQARVTFDDGRSADLLVTLQGRAATATTDAFCTLDPHDPDALAAVVRALAAAPP